MQELIVAPSVQFVEELLGAEGRGLWDLSEDFETAEEGDWEDDGKYQHKYTVLLHAPSKTFYGISLSRTGSYYSEYCTNVNHVEKVRKVEVVKTVTEWVAV